MKNLIILLATTFSFGLQVLAQPTAELCLVTVDTSYTHNVVVWERGNVVGTAPVDSIRIWRADASGNYGIVGGVHFDSLSEYHDYTADPNVQAYYYAIQAVDNNGVSGPLSDIHGTIHFSVLDDGSGSLHLLWTPYVGHVVDVYDCWEDEFGTNAFSLVNSTLNGNDTDWTNSNPPSTWTNLWYKIDVQWTLSCESTRASHNTTRSNKSQPVAGGVGISDDKPGLTALYLFPNPVKENLTVKYSSLRWIDSKVELYDINGRLVHSSTPVRVLGQYSLEINTINFKPGVYMVKVTNGNESVTKKLIISE